MNILDQPGLLEEMLVSTSQGLPLATAFERRIRAVQRDARKTRR